MRSPMDWSRVFRDATGRFVATAEEAVAPLQGVEYWIDRLSLTEALHPSEQESLRLWLETPEGRKWAEEG